jgi:RNA polymerase sigma factor for flagellar operon FliA
MESGSTAPLDEESQLWSIFVESRNTEAREQLFGMHLGYAKAIAARLYRGRTRDDVEFADYYQLACVGLLESIERYQPTGLATFRTYCTRRIEGNVLDGAERLTEAQQQLALKRRIRKERLASVQSSAQPSVLKETLARLTEVAVGLAIGFMLEETGMFLAPDDVQAWHSSPYDTAAWTQAKARLLEFVAILPDRERKVIEYHYLQGIQFDQIAQLLSLTKGRVSQIHKEALARLRQNAIQLGTMSLTG